MNILKSSLIIVVLLALMVAMASLYTVREGQLGIVLRLGRVETDAAGNSVIKHPGLHFKMPLIEHVHLFDVRLQTLELPHSRVVTSEQKDVMVDYFVKWRINDPVVYYKTTSGSEMQARTLLTQQLNDKLRAEFGQRTIGEVISDARLQIMHALESQANASARGLGLEVVDVRIKRIDLPESVSQAVFERMRTERKRVATEHRATGRAEAEAIRTRALADKAVAIAKANTEAAKTRAEGDEAAAKIYSEVYGKDPNFYAFLRSITAYKDVFTHRHDVLVLRPYGQFFKFFANAEGRDLVPTAQKQKG